MLKLFKSSLLILFISFGVYNQNSFAELKPKTNGQSAENIDPKVAVPELVKLGINAKVTKYKDPRFNNLEFSEDKYYLDIQLGRLSLSQFNQLKYMFGQFNSVKYDELKSYDLIDFLPLPIQAVVNKTFTPINYDFNSATTSNPMIQDFIDKIMNEINTLPDDSPIRDAFGALWYLQKNSVTLRANCWNTTMEVLNFISTGQLVYNLQIPGRTQTDDSLQDKALFTYYTDIKQARNYDLMAFYMKPSKSDMTQMSNLNHTAIVIGQNLVFEKTDSSENDPYRIALKSDVIGKYKKIFKSKLQIKTGRLNSGKSVKYGDPDQFDFKGESKNVFNALFSEFKNQNPIFDSKQLFLGCEVGFGGGCDMYYYQKYSAQIAVDPQSGRGVLNLSPEILKQFHDLTHK